jgi:hypothetical protein
VDDELSIAPAPSQTPQVALTLDQEADELIFKLAVLKDRASALKDLIDQGQARLRLLMKNRGETRRQTDDGNALFYEQRTFEVTDPDELAKLFTKDELARGFKPSADFFDAAKAVRLPIEKCITAGVDERFKVERRRTAASSEQQDRIIKETKREAEQRVNELARLMRSNRARERTA